MKFHANAALAARGAIVIITAATCLISLYYIAQSAYLGWDLARPVPYWDQWWFLLDYFDYVDGKYEFSRLFSPHNEHRIFTSRLFFFADAIFFRMSGTLLIVTIYSTLALIAIAVAAIASRGTSRMLVPATTVLLGLLWSVAQWENLSWGFQTQFPLMHLFALVTLLAFALALVAESHRALWLTIACALDFLCIFSLGSGMLLGGGAIALSVWLRKFNRTVLIFLLVHATLSILNLYGGRSAVPYASIPPLEYLKFAFLFIGAAFRGWPSVTMLAGGLLFAATISLASVATWRALIKRQSIDVGVAVLLALSLIVTAEAFAASFTRASLGLGQASVSRYAMPSLILLSALLGAAWRITYSTTFPQFGQLWLAVGAIAALTAANPQSSVVEWRENIRWRDMAAFAFVNGMFPEPLTKIVYAHPEFSTAMNRLQDMGYGLFSPDAGVYKPPLGYLSELNVAILPECRSGIDIKTKLGRGIYQVTGWALAPQVPRRAGWILAFTESGVLVGSTRVDTPRPDLVQAFALPLSEGAGFNLVINAAKSEGSIRLVATLERTAGKGPRACALTLTLN